MAPADSPHARATWSPEILAALAQLPEKLRRFTTAYLNDPNLTKAAELAGYSGKAAGQTGYKMIRDERVQMVLRLFHQVAVTDALVTESWILERLKENVERAMQAIPVVDREGKETGEYRYEGAVANGALGLLGKHKGMFIDRVKLEGDEPIHLTVDFGRLKGTGRFLPPPPPRGGARVGSSSESQAAPRSGPRPHGRQVKRSTAPAPGGRRGRSRRRAA